MVLFVEKKLPSVYSLLPNKNQETYEELFRIVKQHVERIPKCITIDFEKSSRKCIWRFVIPSVIYLVVFSISNNVYGEIFM